MRPHRDSQGGALSCPWVAARYSLDTTHRMMVNAQTLIEEDTVIVNKPSERFVLWVDAVGGYLVCLGDEIVLGQAVPGTSTEVPILGDLSRRHATIQRESGDYIIEASQSSKINGKNIGGRALLVDGMEIELGSSVRLRFRKPHALSATARMDLLSRHRTQPTADGILLMAESCVLGPRKVNHIVCRDWSEDVVLYRKDDELYCRATESIEIDEKVHDRRGPITSNSHIVGNDFALSLEQI